MKKHGQTRRRMVALFNLVKRGERATKRQLHDDDCGKLQLRSLPCTCLNGPLEVDEPAAVKWNMWRAIELDKLRSRLTPVQAYHAERGDIEPKKAYAKRMKQRLDAVEGVAP